MARPGSDTLTPREAQIMEVLWSEGHATAEQFRTALPDEPHDSTVRTLLRVLRDKGYVRSKNKGKAYVYSPAVKRASAEAQRRPQHAPSLLRRVGRSPGDEAHRRRSADPRAPRSTQETHRRTRQIG